VSSVDRQPATEWCTCAGHVVSTRQRHQVTRQPQEF